MSDRISRAQSGPPRTGRGHDPNLWMPLTGLPDGRPGRTGRFRTNARALPPMGSSRQTAFIIGLFELVLRCTSAGLTEDFNPAR